MITRVARDPFARQCQKCKHMWSPQQTAGVLARLPKICPKCKSYAYNRPLVRGVGRKKQRSEGSTDSGNMNYPPA